MPHTNPFPLLFPKTLNAWNASSAQAVQSGGIPDLYLAYFGDVDARGHQHGAASSVRLSPFDLYSFEDFQSHFYLFFATYIFSFGLVL
jgi:hypothetical protein